MPFVHMSLDFRSPLRPDDEVETTVLLDRLGRSSLATRVIGRLADGRVAFEGRFVQVFVDGDAMTSRPIPDEFVARLTGERAIAGV